ncbi:MAG: ABC transporter ATP-binding protein [Treponema sp. GWB1_62_6]|nr:MAG: ABC transporter ATP-binding protein [Treponema sp. GWA1_62_8]OHE63236.1 MAG: ABC transporter ATP-binding protein [Treponema sp. GWB1_62_6]OHE69928.1 MAG: ABC transporter ATP-binding protein [Treponema sp. GWC1_61_84]OHE70555.1 MAG: ABC transporter ATP-binding protein [Treponema sp. RIFOXYC1_FULL_61_9]HCM28061.1 ABC transporter ATP-binding protein [Treponema sp.]
MAPILELVDFHYSYGNIHSVKGINLYVDPGEMVTLIGANGAGKTTTLQTISGLTKPTGIRGKIIFNGKEIQGMRGNAVAGLGVIQALEGRRIFSKLTVEENLMVGAYLRKDAKAVKEDMEDVFRRFPRLLERRTQLGGTLSGGEQQMLAIGRALLGKPKILLLDEPSLGLAPLIVKEIFRVVNDINREGTTILFVEQNSKIALSTADRGYVMQTGEVVIQDTCQNLLANEEIKKAYLGA